MDYLLRVQNLSKSFLFKGKQELILDNISFEVSAHEFISIIGPSGCGKSTLLELIAGITLPNSGSIIKNNNEITGKTGHAGYMPQGDMLLPWLSLIDNVILPCKVNKCDVQTSRAKAISLLPDFGLAGYEHYRPWQLSGGMKQRTAFLRTVLSASELLLLDEPFANLDALTRLQLQNWLYDIKNKLKQTIILVTHDIDEAIRLSDTIYVMDSVPAQIIHQETIPVELHQSKDLATQTLWMDIKTRLTDKLLK
jgi:ABC-type nitrate/sulfonate/bicarbonate transport system ATPase subunit